MTNYYPPGLPLPWWNLSEHEWIQQFSWIDFLRVKASFGYQGNMLSDQTPLMIISKKPTNAYYNENVATVERYPNPDLKWETTRSYNLGLEFSLFKNKLQIESSYYWKHTEDLMTKKIASMNGVDGNSYVVNGGDVDNSGYSVALTVSPINTKDFRWTLSTSFSKTFNKMESDPDANQYELNNFLEGTALVKGKAIGTFYSYKFMGLSPVDGGPIFDDGEDNKEELSGLSKYDTYTVS
ncbi:MAG: TonB-dependent receptor domain-containing protein [Butyricimonas faecihominis]